MTQCKKTITIRIKVHPVVYDFYFAQYGERFEMKDDSVLAAILPHLLSLKPKDYNPRYRYSQYNTLTVVVRDMRIGPASENVMYINAPSRHYISDRNQYYISRFLDSIVKNIFHNFMFAYMRAAPEGICQIQAIRDFCQVYRIKGVKMNYEMLKKSWDRSGEKKEWMRIKQAKGKKSSQPPVPNGIMNQKD